MSSGEGTRLEQTRSPSMWMRIPQNPGLLQAAGRVAFAHGHLEHVLRMTVKTLARLTIEDAMDATQNVGARELRESVKRLFKTVTNDEVLRQRLQALLGRAARLGQERNELIHRAWGQDDEETWFVKGAQHAWTEPPIPSELEDLASKIIQVTHELNEARLEGFIAEAMRDGRPGAGTR